MTCSLLAKRQVLERQEEVEEAAAYQETLGVEEAEAEVYHQPYQKEEGEEAAEEEYHQLTLVVVEEVAAEGEWLQTLAAEVVVEGEEGAVVQQ